jgi:hypothetical protein
MIGVFCAWILFAFPGANKDGRLWLFDSLTADSTPLHCVKIAGRGLECSMDNPIAFAQGDDALYFVYETGSAYKYEMFGQRNISRSCVGYSKSAPQIAFVDGEYALVFSSPAPSSYVKMDSKGVWSSARDPARGSGVKWVEMKCQEWSSINSQ